MLKLRSIGLSDYSVLEGRQRIGRNSFGHRTHAVRLALERLAVYLASLQVRRKLNMVAS